MSVGEEGRTPAQGQLLPAAMPHGPFGGGQNPETWGARANCGLLPRPSLLGLSILTWSSLELENFSCTGVHAGVAVWSLQGCPKDAPGGELGGQEEDWEAAMSHKRRKGGREGAGRQGQGISDSQHCD